MSISVIWHDIECGGYRQDLSLWLTLADEYASGPGQAILDVGAGTGRVSLALARAGRTVVALDQDASLLAALAERARAEALAITTIEADARALDLPGQTFTLCVVPMQTIQLFGGPAERDEFLSAARRHLTPGGVLAVAIADSADFEEFEWHDGDPFPLPDIIEVDGTVYSSQPTAVKRAADSFILTRRREVIDPHGERSSSEDLITLDAVAATEMEEAGQRAGLKPLGVRSVAPTSEHIGSEVVLLAR